MNLYQWQHQTARVFTPELLCLIDRCCRPLSAAGQTPEALEAALEAVGRHFSLPGVLACLPQGLAQAWSAPGTGGEPPDLSSLEQGEPWTELREALERDGMILTSHIGFLAPALYDSLYPQGIRSLLLLPIFAEGGLCGFAGAADFGFRQWTPKEVAALQILCAVLAGGIRPMEGA